MLNQKGNQLWYSPLIDYIKSKRKKPWYCHNETIWLIVGYVWCCSLYQWMIMFLTVIFGVFWFWYVNWFLIFQQLVPWLLFYLLLLDVWLLDCFDLMLCLFPCDHLLHCLASYCYFICCVGYNSNLTPFLFSFYFIFYLFFCLFHSFFSILLKLFHLFSLNCHSFCQDFLFLLPAVSFWQDFCQELTVLQKVFLHHRVGFLFCCFLLSFDVILIQIDGLLLDS